MGDKHYSKSRTEVSKDQGDQSNTAQMKLNASAEKDLLLSLNADISTAKNKAHILDLIHPKLKKLFGSDDIFICLLDNETKTLKPFLRTAHAERNLIEEYQSFMHSTLNAGDQFINTIIHSPEPVVYDMEEVKKWNQPPKYLPVIIQSGLQSSLSMALKDGELPIGVVTIWHEYKNAFSKQHIKLLQTVAAQVSLAMTNIIDNEKISARDQESDILHQLSNKIAGVKNRSDLANFLTVTLNNFVPYSAAVVSVINQASKKHRIYATANGRHQFNYAALESELNRLFNYYDISRSGALQPVVISKKEFDTTGILVSGNDINEDLEENASIVLADSKLPIGVFMFFTDRQHTFKPGHLKIIQRISYQISIAVAKLLAHEEIIERENEKELLLSFSTHIAAVRNKEDVLKVVNSSLHKIFDIGGFAIALVDENEQTHMAFLFDLDEGIKNDPDFNQVIDGHYKIHDGFFDKMLGSDEPFIIKSSELPESNTAPAYVRFWKKMEFPYIVGVPLKVGEKLLGALLFHLSDSNVSKLNTFLLKGLCSQLSIALSHILANEKIARQFDEINRYKEQLEEEKLYLQEEVGSGLNFKDIIGEGPSMQKVFQQLSQVAFANSTVLLLGETGTGKELIARAIHNLSSRKEKLLVKINCAALPVNLIESELFGHEKGSFTGAMERRIGKFELANEGTLFLDEIGEMPLELQSKLLRAVQEREIERIGGKTTIKVNVRLIAATNRNLFKEVEEGKFRQDLFYRLNVFPITLPSLKERKEDIPELVKYFIAKYSKNAGSIVTNISGKAMKELMAYDWPGNVRELEHFIERSVLITVGSTIKNAHLTRPGNDSAKKITDENLLKSLEQNERDHIIRILNYCKGKIFGTGGAAEILGIPVSTLNSKIKKLGIEKSSRYSIKDNSSRS